MEKQLITVGLNELATGDREGLGSLFERDRKVYRWVKNYTSTSLVASGSCVTIMTSVEANVEKRVGSPDVGPATGPAALPAGVPVTAIGPSGSDTGDHGWVLVKGVTKTRVYQLTTAYTGGEMAPATSASPTTGCWDGAAHIVGLIDTDGTGKIATRGVLILNAVATTGAATFVTAVVNVRCLD